MQKKSVWAKGNVLAEYVRGNIDIEDYDFLISDLIEDITEIDLTSSVFDYEAKYVPSEDTLGFIYISLTNICERKANGAYYTPLEVVNNLVSNLKETTELSGKTIFDPCCGSGNFFARYRGTNRYSRNDIRSRH
jgi:type I restriction-modification system DNA methylase subunit